MKALLRVGWLLCSTVVASGEEGLLEQIRSGARSEGGLWNDHASLVFRKSQIVAFRSSAGNFDRSQKMMNGYASALLFSDPRSTL